MDRAESIVPAERERLQDFAEAERIQAGINALRLARGDVPAGYKIGFTNRSIWPLYGVFQPIWAPVWRAGIVDLSPDPANAGVGAGTGAGGWFDARGRLAIDRFCQPRLEPEIVVGLRAAPTSAAPEALAATIDWVAHGFEIVHSVWPDWRFSAAESFAGQALHGLLLIGPRRRVAARHGAAAALVAALSAVRLELSEGGRPVAAGDGTAVLDGPVQALSHLVAALIERRSDTAAAFTLGAGSIVTTGTLTDAQPLLPGQRWQTRLTMPAAASRGDGGALLAAPLAGLTLET